MRRKTQLINAIILTLVWNPHAVQLSVRKERASSLDFILWASLCFQIAKQLFFHVLTNKTYKERPWEKGISTGQLPFNWAHTFVVLRFTKTKYCLIRNASTKVWNLWLRFMGQLHLSTTLYSLKKECLMITNI